ncbi:DUF2158 domain-containing protein [Comamonadaceae bacterium OH3737_COT-264]|nr:DUF2158 domain-containing protein [Comamonadaceae bacterium OH3737_COT-264]
MAKAQTLAVGTIVKLKSGGPDMTVYREVNLSSGTFIRCQWFAGKKLESGDFDPDSLELVKPEAKGA